MSGELREHIRQNVIGYVALFLVISGGTAYATHPGGANTISSQDIINQEVKTADLAGQAVTLNRIAADSVSGVKVVDDSLDHLDLADQAVRTGEIANNQVRSADVRDDTLAGGGLNAQDLNPDSVGASEVVDGSLDAAEIADTGSLGTAEINEGDLFNDDSLDAADVANNSPLGTAEINEGNLNVVEGPSNMRMFFGREQLSFAEASGVALFASGVANVNVQKQSPDGADPCSLTFLNSPSGGTLTFVREVVSGTGITLTSGTLGPQGTNSTAFSTSPVQVRWQAWAAGNPSATGRVITVDAAARPSGETCDVSAVMTVGA